jgi:futalosine hydrolase
MNCLLVAATAFEIAPLLDQHRKGLDNLPKHISLDILISGIGLTAASYSLTKQLHIKQPDLVIQAGIAGCFDSSMPLGNVVAVKKECIADLGVIEQQQWKTLFDLKLLDQNQFPFSKRWLVNKNDILKKVKARKVAGISINEISSHPKKIAVYRQLFDPVVESMEGAALHYVCLQEKIPFIQLRGISNYVGERNKKKWMIKESIINLNKELSRLLQQL